MKKINKFKLFVIIFVVIMMSIAIFFMIRINNIQRLNKAKDLLSYLYTLEYNDYSYIDGKVYKDNYLLNDKMFFEGNGDINIDKYGNVRFLINQENKCFYKTYLGSIKITNNKCENFNNINVSLVKNNSKISFILNNNNLSYKLSNKDDFKGEWKSKEYKDNLVLNSYNEGFNYIWFKDKDGNISDVIEFNVDCLSTSKTDYKSSVFYCSGSKVYLDNIEWVVLEDKNDSIKLMKYLPLDNKLSQCFDIKSEYCYYTKEVKMPHKWSNSYINYYLNNVFINELSTETKNKLITEYICDEYDNLSCDNEMCGGYSKEEINYYNWKCTNYTPSKIKIISYDEYNRIYSKLDKKDVINGNYWAINSYTNDKGSSVQYNYEFYILEDYTKKLDVKPIITIKK